MLAERVELHGVPGQLDGHERQSVRVDLRLPRGGGKRGGEPGVVEGRLTGARRRVDQHESLAGSIAYRVPETGSSVDPLRLDLVADDELARAGGSAEELLRGLVVLSGAHRVVLSLGQARWTMTCPPCLRARTLTVRSVFSGGEHKRATVAEDMRAPRSPVRGLGTSGSGLTARRRLAGIEGPLVLTLLCPRNLDVHHQDGTGP
jgi:hypothetical protein